MKNIRRADLKSMTEDELEIGAVHSLLNSYSLFHDAMILSCVGRYTRAYTLIQLSIEEAGKSLTLNELSFFQKHKNISSENRSDDVYLEKLEKAETIFYDHPGKSEESIMFMIAMIKNMFLDAKREASEIEWLQKEMNPKNLNIMKNLSLYVDVSNGSFEIPHDTVSEQQFSKLQSVGFSILNYSKRYVFNNEKILKQIGLDPELVNKLDPYSESRRLRNSIDLNKYYSKPTIGW